MVGSIIGNAEPHPATRRSPEEALHYFSTWRSIFVLQDAPNDQRCMKDHRS